MSRWTKWRKIADKENWYDDYLDHDGPACYEIGIGGPLGGNIEIVYIGETINEKSRVINYARNGSHLSKEINYHLKQGYCIYYRAQIKRTKVEAVEMQNKLLYCYEYDWNKQRNR